MDMAFGIKKEELNRWKSVVMSGEVALLTHYWYDERFPQYNTVTKAGCSDREKLIHWGKRHGLKEEWLHERARFPHFDLIGKWEKNILENERTFQTAVLINGLKRRSEV